METPDAEAWIEPDWEARHSRAPPPVQGELRRRAPGTDGFVSELRAVQGNVSPANIPPSLPRSWISSRGLQQSCGFSGIPRFPAEGLFWISELPLPPERITQIENGECLPQLISRFTRRPAGPRAEANKFPFRGRAHRGKRAFPDATAVVPPDLRSVCCLKKLQPG